MFKNLHDAVPPVVGPLDVLDVVDVVEGGDEGRLEALGVGGCSLAAETVGVRTHERLDLEGGGGV